MPTDVRSGSDGVEVQEVPGGQYAAVSVARVNTDDGAQRRSIAAMEWAFRYMLDEWLPRNAFRLEDRPCLEVYVTPMALPDSVEPPAYLATALDGIRAPDAIARMEGDGRTQVRGGGAANSSSGEVSM